MIRVLGFCVLGSLSYAVVWSWLASPYSFFAPTDHAVLTGSAFPFYPVYQAWLKLALWLNPFFSEDPRNALLLQGLMANAFSVAFIGLLAYRMTERVWVCLVTMILFGASTWPAVYLFKVSQAPLMGALSLALLVCLVEGYQDTDRSKRFLLFSGLIAAAQLLTSFWAVPLVVLQFVMIFLLFASWKYSDRWKLFALHLAPLAVCLTLYFVNYYDVAAAHVKNVWEASQFSRSLVAHGEMPGTPFASLYYIGNFYGPFIFYFSLVASAFYAFFFLDLKRHRTTPEKILFLFATILLLHPLLIDLTPIPAMARAHFPIYPIAVLLSVCFAVFWIEKINKVKGLMTVVVSAAFVVTLYYNVKNNFDLITVKQSASKFAQQLKNKRLVAHAKDAHSSLLADWLQLPLNRVDSIGSIDKQNVDGVVVGPQGYGSGLSLFFEARSKDFRLLETPPIGMKRVLFPYYAYFPAFAMEEAPSASLYFSKQLPDFRAPNLQLQFWLWETTS